MISPSLIGFLIDVEKINNFGTFECALGVSAKTCFLMTMYIFESPLGLSISIMQSSGKTQRLVKGAQKGEKVGREKRKMNGSMQEGNRVLGNRDGGKGKTVDKEEMQIKMEIRK